MLNLKKYLPLALLLLIACKQESKHNDSYIDAQVDSIVGSRMEEINRRAMEDLDHRMAIEVKQKADSIIAARRATADSAAPKSTPIAPAP